MNKSNFAHMFLAVVTQIAIGFGVSLFVPCEMATAFAIASLFPIGFYFGREVAQAERKAGTPPWYSGFAPKNWSKDNFFDFAFPVIGCGLVVLIAIAL